MNVARKMGGDVRILVFSLVALAILGIIGVLFAPPADAPALSIRSTKPDGAMALLEWLRASGYETQELTSLDKQLTSLDVLFIMQPIFDYDQADHQHLKDWVQEGGTLIVVGSPFSLNLLLGDYDARLEYGWDDTPALSPAAPTLINPPFDSATVFGAYPIRSERDDMIPYVFNQAGPVLVSLTEGAGQVWISGALRPFSNLGLRDPGNARLVANLLAGLPKTAVIGFDEVVHGFGEEDVPQTFAAWLFRTPPGWGILTGVTLTMVFLGLRGRRFGRAIPLPDDRLRRESVEYIQAMGTLFRRSGQRNAVLKHYHDQLRRRLTERYALDPNVDLVAAVAARDTHIDVMKLRHMMSQLQRQTVSEAELVKITSEVDEFLRSLN